MDTGAPREAASVVSPTSRIDSRARAAAYLASAAALAAAPPVPDVVEPVRRRGSQSEKIAELAEHSVATKVRVCVH